VVETAPDDVMLAQSALAATRGVPRVAHISRGRYVIARTYGLGGTVVKGIQFAPEPGSWTCLPVEQEHGCQCGERGAGLQRQHQ
jgi:hypothetical protein